MIYKKVLTKDRLPDEGGNYDTSKGFLAFIPAIKRWYYDNRVMVETPEYWFEEINIPTDEEIEKIAIECTSTRSEYLNHLTGFKSALKYMEGK